MATEATAAGGRLDRRTFLKAAGASAVMVQVFGQWPGATTLAAEEVALTDAVPPPWPLREASLHGPPLGSPTNIVRRTDVVDRTTVTTWGSGGGRALSISVSSKSVRVHYLDPTRRASTRQVALVPLDELDHELRSHFGDRAWRDMRQMATTS